MKTIKASYEILTDINDNMLKEIERAARTCYKSEGNITDTSAQKLVSNLIASNHLAMLEHCSISVRFITDRGVTHEIVRHRMCAYAQESTRYVNYNKKGCTFIKPLFWKKDTPEYRVWYASMQYAEDTYNQLIECGCTPQQARCVLPHSTKTEIVVTANLREWLHIFELRCAKDAHPQIREVMIPLLMEFTEKLPTVFGSIPITEEMKDFYNNYIKGEQYE